MSRLANATQQKDLAMLPPNPFRYLLACTGLMAAVCATTACSPTADDADAPSTSSKTAVTAAKPEPSNAPGASASVDPKAAEAAKICADYDFAAASSVFGQYAKADQSLTSPIKKIAGATVLSSSNFGQLMKDGGSCQVLEFASADAAKAMMDQDSDGGAATNKEFAVGSGKGRIVAGEMGGATMIRSRVQAGNRLYSLTAYAPPERVKPALTEAQFNELKTATAKLAGL